MKIFLVRTPLRQDCTRTRSFRQTAEAVTFGRETTITKRFREKYEALTNFQILADHAFDADASAKTIHDQTHHLAAATSIAFHDLPPTWATTTAEEHTAAHRRAAALAHGVVDPALH